MPRKSFYKMNDGFLKHDVIPQFGNMRVNEEKNYSSGICLRIFSVKLKEVWVSRLS